MKLQQKFFIIFFLIAAIPILLITAVAYHRYSTTAYDQMDEYSHNVFGKAVQQTNNTLDQVNKAANMFTFYSNEANSLIQNLKPYADPEFNASHLEIYQTKQNIKYMCLNLTNSYDFIYGLYVFTPSGVTLDYEDNPHFKLAPDYNPHGEIWYEDTMSLQGNLYVSDVSTHNAMFSNSQDSVFFAKYLYDVYSHKYLGILLINCSPKIFDLNNINTMPEMVEFYLYNKHAEEMVNHIDDRPTLPQSPVSSKLETFSSPLNHPDLELTAVINYEKLYQTFNLTGTILVTLAISSLLAALILTYFLSRYLTRPIVRLSHIMSMQGDDNFSGVEAFHSRKDEIGVLYNEYNQMMEKLRNYIKTDYQNKLIAMDAQMKSLEARINSHFLFNTLASFNSIAEIEGSERLSEMSIALGNMFRYTIKTKSELVTLEEELSHVQDYITIQSIRFDNAFSYILNIPKSMYSFTVLKLILQPLVENSIIHGLSNFQTGSRIEISSTSQGSLLYITVTDDGQGIDDEQLIKLQESLNEEAEFIELGHRNNRSIGIKNIHSRIKLYYGEQYGLSISSSKYKGTSIVIKLPILGE